MIIKSLLAIICLTAVLPLVASEGVEHRREEESKSRLAVVSYRDIHNKKSLQNLSLPRDGESLGDKIRILMLDKKPIGYLKFFAYKNDAWSNCVHITHVEVQEQHRKKGYGAYFMRHFLKNVAGEEIRLYSFENPAVGFFKKCGFQSDILRDEMVIKR